MADHDSLISQYSGITGDKPSRARQILEAFDWNLEAAVEDHFATHQDEANDPDYEDDEPATDDSTPIHSGDNGGNAGVGGGFRLGQEGSATQRVGAAPPPTAAASSHPPRNTGSSKKFATLGDFSSDAPRGGGDDDDEDDDDRQDMFAGGEKSGLAVQNPDDLKKKIIEKAAKGQKQPEETPKKSNFVGSARTLGGDDAPSREIPADPSTQPTERVRRILHFWADGFSIDDGDLFRFDDPGNAEMLRLIRSGRAPLHMMNVALGQEVDVEVRPHEENYVQPKKKFKAFEGSGNRLGAPTPGTSTSNSSTMPGSFTSDRPAAPAPAPSQAPASSVDESKPTVTLRVSLASGTRLTSRFNTDQTIGDVYEFVERAESGGRAFVLQTTFPTTDLIDHSKVLGDMAEFKRGGAVVQKYT